MRSGMGHGALPANVFTPLAPEPVSQLRPTRPSGGYCQQEQVNQSSPQVKGQATIQEAAQKLES